MDSKAPVRDSIALFGLDLKLTEDGGLVILEVNGANSGIKGYAQANGTDARIVASLEAALKPFGLPVYVLGGSIADGESFQHISWKSEEYYRIWKALEYSAWHGNRVFHGNPGLSDEASMPLSYLSADFPREWVHPNWLNEAGHESLGRSLWRNFVSMWHQSKAEEGAQDLPRASWGNADAVLFDRTPLAVRRMLFPGLVIYSDHREVFDEGRVMLANSPGIETLMFKENLRILFDDANIPVTRDLMSIRARYALKKMDLESPVPPLGIDGRYVVVKPERRSNAHAVEIMELDELMNGKMPAWYDAVKKTSNAFLVDDPYLDLGFAAHKEAVSVTVQEFVPGKPVVNPHTGKAHSATARYLVLMVSQGGEIRTHLLGGYWRLAPYALSSHMSLNHKYIANLHPDNRLRAIRPSIPVPLSGADEAFVAAQLESFLPAVYGRILEYEPHALKGTLEEHLDAEWRQTPEVQEAERYLTEILSGMGLKI
ncbi:hypothetical protein HYV82_04375 [Candidatus Woesearchaeota archaeon]|nr:hypothetical protein [Candidatus Woesearchaeota archaeon]